MKLKRGVNDSFYFKDKLDVQTVEIPQQGKRLWVLIGLDVRGDSGLKHNTSLYNRPVGPKTLISTEVQLYQF